jgi:hypothetical protein
MAASILSCIDCGAVTCGKSTRCKGCARKESCKNRPRLPVVVDACFMPVVEKTRWFDVCGYLAGYPMGRQSPPWKLHQYVWYLANSERVCGLDHVNGDRHDNRLENLRRATRVLQGHNRLKPPRPRHRPNRKASPWEISFRYNGVHHSKCFPTQEQAAEWGRNAREIIIEFEALKAGN